MREQFVGGGGGGGGGGRADGYGSASAGCSHLTHSRGTFSSIVIRPASVSE